ncbi:MAG: hypothetical protein LBQ73_06710 [Tannerellaceae bacterium]|jgi:hypothetical protein|nr:hypothetical protein [Tannerellaceae bacterium]
MKKLIFVTLLIFSTISIYSQDDYLNTTKSNMAGICEDSRHVVENNIYISHKLLHQATDELCLGGAFNLIGIGVLALSPHIPKESDKREAAFYLSGFCGVVGTAIIIKGVVTLNKAHKALDKKTVEIKPSTEGVGFTLVF